MRITGRKKEILVTAGGKNVSPAVLEDRMRAHALVSQCLVVGDGQPFIAALVTLDAESLPAWAEAHGKAGSTLADLADDPDLRAEIQAAVDEANRAVSKRRVDPQVRRPDPRLDRGGRAAHAQPEAEAQRRDARGPRRGGRPVRRLSRRPARPGSPETPVQDFTETPVTGGVCQYSPLKACRLDRREAPRDSAWRTVPSDPPGRP